MQRAASCVAQPPLRRVAQRSTPVADCLAMPLTNRWRGTLNLGQVFGHPRCDRTLATISATELGHKSAFFAHQQPPAGCALSALTWSVYARCESGDVMAELLPASEPYVFLSYTTPDRD